MTHGHSRGRQLTPEYRAWTAMKTRCTNPRSKSYKYYGGRGIRVCELWLRSFAAFLAYVGHKPSPKHTLDRIDSNGNYEPGNVRWATQREQMNNQRANRHLTWKGTTKTIAQWARTLHISRDTIKGRLQHGWTVAETLSTPVTSKVLITYRGKTMNLTDWARAFNLPPRALHYRVRMFHWPFKKAISTPLHSVRR